MKGMTWKIIPSVAEVMTARPICPAEPSVSSEK